MELVFPPSPTIFYVLGPPAGVVLVAMLVACRVKRWPAWKGLAMAAPFLLLFGVIARLAYQAHHLTVDEVGLHADEHGGVTVPWATVRRARVVDRVWSSPLRPVRRTSGTSDGRYQSGWWTLADGESGYLMM